MTADTKSMDIRPSHGDITGSATMSKVDQPQRLLGYAVLRAARDQVGEARVITQQAAAEHPSSDLAVLLVSELMTNAIVHSGSQFVTLVIAMTAGNHLRISVIDEGRSGLPQLLSSGSYDEHGRGVRLVDQLAKRWGIKRERPAGMTVWFELDERPPEAWFDAAMSTGDL